MTEIGVFALCGTNPRMTVSVRHRILQIEMTWLKGIQLFIVKDQVSIFCNIHQLCYAKRERKRSLQASSPTPWLTSIQLMNLTEQIHKKTGRHRVRDKLEIRLLFSPHPANTDMIQITKTDHGTIPMPASHVWSVSDAGHCEPPSLNLVGF